MRLDHLLSGAMTVTVEEIQRCCSQTMLRFNFCFVYTIDSVIVVERSSGATEVARLNRDL